MSKIRIDKIVREIDPASFQPILNVFMTVPLCEIVHSEMTDTERHAYIGKALEEAIKEYEEKFKTEKV